MDFGQYETMLNAAVGIVFIVLIGIGYTLAYNIFN